MIKSPFPFKVWWVIKPEFRQVGEEPLQVLVLGRIRDYDGHTEISNLYSIQGDKIKAIAREEDLYYTEEEARQAMLDSNDDLSTSLTRDEKAKKNFWNLTEKQKIEIRECAQKFLRAAADYGGLDGTENQEDAQALFQKIIDEGCVQDSDINKFSAMRINISVQSLLADIGIK